MAYRRTELALVVTFTLITEGALLFVAAQTGFIGGPRVLATMAHDRWLPRRFSNLSARLVTQDGVLAMGLAAAVSRQTRVEVTTGRALRDQRVRDLHAVATRDERALVECARHGTGWARKLLINGIGCAFTPSILLITVTLKFNQGGWVTIVITSARWPSCFVVRGHYDHVAKCGRRLEADILPKLFSDQSGRTGLARSRSAYRGVAGERFQRPRPRDAKLQLEGFPEQFRNIVFVGVGEVDSLAKRP